MKKIILLVLISFLAFTCTVQKRRYQKGFYVNHSSGKIKTLAITEPKTEQTYTQPAAAPDSCDLLEFTDGTSIKGKIASISSMQIEYYYCDESDQIHKIAKTRVLKVKHADGTTEWFAGTPPPEPIKVIPPPSGDAPVAAAEPTANQTPLDSAQKGCDRIVFRDGREEFAKITEVGTSEIRYKLCSMLSGPDFIKPKSSIFMIQYSNGQKDLFKEEVVEEQQYQYTPRRRTNSKLATWSLIASTTGFYPIVFLGSIAAIILALIYLNKAATEPEVYISCKLAIAGLVIGLLGAILWLSLFLLVI